MFSIILNRILMYYIKWKSDEKMRISKIILEILLKSNSYVFYYFESNSYVFYCLSDKILMYYIV